MFQQPQNRPHLLVNLRLFHDISCSMGTALNFVAIVIGCVVFPQLLYWNPGCAGGRLPDLLWHPHPGALTLDTNHLFECVNNFHQITLSGHYRFYRFVGSWSFVENAAVFAAFHASGGH